MSDRIRFTIAVDPDVHDAFADLAEKSGVSLSRCIGDWLRDTAEAAQMTAIKVQEVRDRPVQALETYLRSMLPEVERLVANPPQRRGAATAHAALASRGQSGSSSARGSATPFSPPSCNTGGKVPRRGTK